MVCKFEMILLILLTFLQAVPCGGSALLASMQEWQAGLSPKFYLTVTNSSGKYHFILLSKVFCSNKILFHMHWGWEFFGSFNCLSQEHKLLVLLELETHTDGVHWWGTLLGPWYKVRCRCYDKNVVYFCWIAEWLIGCRHSWHCLTERVILFENSAVTDERAPEKHHSLLLATSITS